MYLRKIALPLLFISLTGLNVFAANFRSLQIPAFAGTITNQIPGLELVSVSLNPEWPYDGRNRLEKMLWYGGYSKGKVLPPIDLSFKTSGNKIEIQIPNLNIDSGEGWFSSKKGEAFVLKLKFVFKHPDGSIIKTQTYGNYINEESIEKNLAQFKEGIQNLTLEVDGENQSARLVLVERYGKIGQAIYNYFSVIEPAVVSASETEVKADPIQPDPVRSEPIQLDIFNEFENRCIDVLI